MKPGTADDGPTGLLLLAIAALILGALALKVIDQGWPWETPPPAPTNEAKP